METMTEIKMHDLNMWLWQQAKTKWPDYYSQFYDIEYKTGVYTISSSEFFSADHPDEHSMLARYLLERSGDFIVLASYTGGSVWQKVNKREYGE